MKFYKCFSIICLLSGAQAWACPESLKSYGTEFLQGSDLCSIYDRYQMALQKLRDKKIENPERIGNLRAPRFINLPDWLEKRNSVPNSALLIYEPAPTTWLTWEVGAQFLDEAARKNFLMNKIPKLELNWLKKLHGSTLNGIIATAGKFRTNQEFGLVVKRKEALTWSQLEAVRNVEYKSLLDSTQRIVRFQATPCLEDRTDRFVTEYPKQNRYQYTFNRQDWPEIDDYQFFIDSNGDRKMCGILKYALKEEVDMQVTKWLEFINNTTETWGTAMPKGDPILVAARAQRWLIAIHPFEQGNGRMSRFVMDWLLQSLGLPAPILKNMDEDMYSNEQEWAREVGQGILRAVTATESCAQNPAAVGCAVISKSLSETRELPSSVTPVGPAQDSP